MKRKITSMDITC